MNVFTNTNALIVEKFVLVQFYSIFSEGFSFFLNYLTYIAQAVNKFNFEVFKNEQFCRKTSGRIEKQCSNEN